MTNSQEKANLIWDKLFSISNENKTREEQISMIESVIIQIAKEHRNVGRKQVTNYFKQKINDILNHE